MGEGEAWKKDATREAESSRDVYLFGGPLRQAALVQVADAVGVGLHRFFFQVAHKGVTQLGGHHVCHKVGIEEDALQQRETDSVEIDRH